MSKLKREHKNSHRRLQYSSKDELICSERLAFTGRIAASIAHEIRNPLTNVSMAARQLQKAIAPENPWTRHTEVIIRNTERINYLITELLNCARPPKLNIYPYDIHMLLENVLESNKTKINSQDIEVVKGFTSKTSILNMDREQMERVFSNLVVNAIEAMDKRGKLIIVTEIDEGEDIFIVQIKDTGKGIPEEDIIRIFDPFFSTKPAGVGLGLTICYGIIASHGGAIEVESEPKMGSTFTISLPMN